MERIVSQHVQNVTLSFTLGLIIETQGRLGCNWTEFGARKNLGAFGMSQNLEKSQKKRQGNGRSSRFPSLAFAQAGPALTCAATQRHLPPLDLQRAYGAQKEDVRQTRLFLFAVADARRTNRDVPP